ncbi:hypothetical protein M9Y10_000138 [Tritrichomonas musculus]|uniref:FCP1 homology domain-containing protein n=1 Tax=Tritrichomonas musculus TaxID=1915356 RepID=A0ABR2L3G8_9EUKA
MICLNRKPTIVLDLDETIVYTTSIPPVDLHNSFFTIKVKRRKYYVQTRPYLKSFLEKASKLFNICVFTASEQIYADKIIDEILPNVKSTSRFYRDSCMCMNGYFVKNLSMVKSPLNQVLIVDDMPGSALINPKNLIKIKPWYGDKDDQALKFLTTVLENIAFDDDLAASYNEIAKNCHFEGIGTFCETSNIC